MNPNASELTPKQQAAESIRQAGSILVLTGQHPSNDQIAAVLALSLILRKIDKKVTALISDNIPATLNFLPVNQIDKSLTGMRDFVLKVDVTKAEVDKLKYVMEGSKLNIHITPFRGGFAPSDVTFGYGSYHYDLVIVLGVPTRSRIDRVYGDNAEAFAQTPLINIDFHRSNEQYGAVNHIDGYASSLSEILTALAESVQNGLLDEEIATILLTGIISATDRFTATHTTAKSLTVAAQLMAAGAKQQTIVKSLYKSGRADSRSDRPSDGKNQPRNTQGTASSEARSERSHSQSPRRTSQTVEAVKMAEPSLEVPKTASSPEHNTQGDNFEAEPQFLGDAQASGTQPNEHQITYDIQPNYPEPASSEESV